MSDAPETTQVADEKHVRYLVQAYLDWGNTSPREFQMLHPKYAERGVDRINEDAMVALSKPPELEAERDSLRDQVSSLTAERDVLRKAWDDQQNALAVKWKITETEQEAALRDQVKVLDKAARDMCAVLSKFGEWDDGCFYYNRTSASELEGPLQALTDALSAKAPHNG